MTTAALGNTGSRSCFSCRKTTAGRLVAVPAKSQIPTGIPSQIVSLALMDVHLLLAEYLPHLLLGTCGLFLLIQLYYILFVYSRLARHKSKATDEADLPPVTVIICARNEEENLRNFLPSVLSQDYPKFEVILVNDYSEDDSKWLLKELTQTHPHLRVIEIAEHIRLKHGKKFAVTMGVKGAQYEHLVFTDADCQPQSDQWLRKMAAAFGTDKQIVLGYSPYLKQDGLLGLLIQFETYHTAMSYLSYALKGRAYMGVGRNMAYTKSLFFDGKGFASHMHIPSGDDDLFVNQNATRSNTAICIDPESHVWSRPKETFSGYYRQKTRHAGASKAYKPAHRRMLAWQLLSAVLFYVACIVAVAVLPHYWAYVLGTYLLRLLAQLLVYYPIMQKLQAKRLFWWLPLADVFYYFYICINGFFALFKTDVQWK